MNVGCHRAMDCRIKDVSVMAINEPERVSKILGNIQEEGNLEHLTKLMGNFIERECKKGKIV